MQAHKPQQPPPASDETVQAIARVIKKSGKKVAFLLGNRVLREAGLRAASRIGR